MKNIKETSSQGRMKNQPEAASLKSKLNATMNLRDLLIDGLKDMYWAEKALVKALPKMVKNATASDLVYALKSHMEETKNHVTRLEEVFISIDEKAASRKSVVMEGLINEADQIMEETEQGAVLDAGLIGVAQKIEHYEIASYWTLGTFAKTLGEEDATSILEDILAEEREADEAFSRVAEESIQHQARDMNEDGEDNELEENNQENDLDEDDEEADLDEDEDEDKDDLDDLNDLEDDADEEDDYVNVSSRSNRKY